MDHAPRYRICIAGAGLGGLAAAYHLAKEGHEVKVFERRGTFNPRGGTISIRPNATRSLCRWGLRESFDAIADNVEVWSFRDLSSAKELARHTNEDSDGFQEWAVDRKNAQQMLFDQARAAGADIRFGSEVVGVSEDDSEARLFFHDGTTASCDIVLAVDGIGSVLRNQILGTQGPVKPILANATNYSITLNADDPVATGIRKELPQSSVGAIWTGKGQYVISRYAAKVQKVFLVFDIRGESANQEDSPLWEEFFDLDYVRQAFQNAHPSLTSVLASATQCEKWNLSYLPELPTWRSEGGRLLLLGDSAHAMLPNAAQGFSSIVEDIEALGICLTEATKMGIPNATKTWTELRQPRLNKIQDYAKAAYGGFSNSEPMEDQFIQWVIDYDAFKEACIPC